MEKRIEQLPEISLICDNSKCDYQKPNVPLEDAESYINTDCPKCGDNILTEEDFHHLQKVQAIANFVNSMTEEQFSEYCKIIGTDNKEEGPMVKATIGTHKGISIKNIEPV